MCSTRMLDYCELNCDKENAKISVAFNYCFLEKVVLKRRSANQELGLSFISLVDGMLTVGEIAPHSSAAECAHLNVEDDLVAVNGQVVVGWPLASVLRLLEEEFARDEHVFMVLHKMPRDIFISMKQYRQLEEEQQVVNASNSNASTARNNNNNKMFLKSEREADVTGESHAKHKQQHQRKLSFSDIFLA